MEAAITKDAPEQKSVVPSLLLPDASAAQAFVGRWLLKNIGTATYPGEARFLPESFTWHVPVWLSYAERPRIGILADVYVNAANGVFVGIPLREELLRRAEALLEGTN